MQNLNPQIAPDFRFLIVIPVADRPAAISVCLNSIANQLELFSYGRKVPNGEIFRYLDVRVLVIDDGEHSDYGRRLVHDYSSRGLEVDWVERSRQEEILSSYKVARFQAFLGDTQERHPRGAGITGNVAKIVVHHILSSAELGPEWLIWHLDSDHQLTCLTMDAAHRLSLQNDAYDYFRAWSENFSDPAIEMITGPVTGDPTVSPMVMINTILTDLLEFARIARDRSPVGPGIYANPTLENYTSEKMAYYDFEGVLRGRFTRPIDSYMPFRMATTLADQAKAYFNVLPQSLYGHHPTRPIMAPPVEKSNSNLWPIPLPARMIFTGNYIYRARMLRYPLPFVSHKPRLIGPIFGTALRAFEGPSIRFLNLPVYHARIPDGQEAAEARSGVFGSSDLINVETESCRQVVGDVLLRFIENTTQNQVLGPGATEVSSSNIELEVAFSQAILQISQLYTHHIIQTQDLLDQLRRDYFGGRCWWYSLDDMSGPLHNVNLFLQSAQYNFGKSSKISKFVQELPESINAEAFISEASGLEADWIAWAEEILEAPCN